MNYSQFFLETSSGLFDFSILMIRFFIGICFIVHGLGKLGIVGSGNMLGFEGWLKSMNIPFARIQARMAMLTEIIGGRIDFDCHDPGDPRRDIGGRRPVERQRLTIAGRSGDGNQPVACSRADGVMRPG